MTTTNTPASTAEGGTDPYADSPDAGNYAPCDCGGAWHTMRQHCVDWPCPGCDSICPPAPEPGTEDDETQRNPGGHTAADVARDLTQAGGHVHLVDAGETLCVDDLCGPAL